MTSVRDRAAESEVTVANLEIADESRDVVGDVGSLEMVTRGES